MARTVLIVDDHAPFRAAARALLSADGYEVVGEAADGSEAVAAALALAPSIVLLDVGLPDIDGYEVSRRLEAAGSDAVAVLISSRAAAGVLLKDDLSGAVLAERAG